MGWFCFSTALLLPPHKEVEELWPGSVFLCTQTAQSQFMTCQKSCKWPRIVSYPPKSSGLLSTKVSVDITWAGAGGQQQSVHLRGCRWQRPPPPGYSHGRLVTKSALVQHCLGKCPLGKEWGRRAAFPAFGSRVICLSCRCRSIDSRNGHTEQLEDVWALPKAVVLELCCHSLLTTAMPHYGAS